jgi:hypothetical protein
LHADRILIIMFNGDERTTAEAVTRKPGLDRVDAEVLPEKNMNRAVLPQARPGGTSLGAYQVIRRRCLSPGWRLLTNS